jgi:hypothetical protein
MPSNEKDSGDWGIVTALWKAVTDALMFSRVARQVLVAVLIHAHYFIEVAF